MRTVALLAATGLWCLAGFALPQDAPPATFRAAADFVRLDVSVIDRNRRPVRGLTAQDFIVIQDGKPQKVVAFAAVDTPAGAPVSIAEWRRDVAPDVVTNEVDRQTEGRLFILMLDDALIPADPFAVKSAKEIAGRVVDRMGASDQGAVVFSVGGGGSQGFTADRQKLMVAIGTLSPGYATYKMGWDTAIEPPTSGRGLLSSVGATAPMIDADAHFRLASLRTLRFVADSLADVPDRRKVLVLISPGVGVDFQSAAQSKPASVSGSSTQAREANVQLVAEMPEVFRRLQRANVSVYSIDPCGLGGLEAYVVSAVQGLQVLKRSSLPLSSTADFLAPPRPPTPADLAHHTSRINLDYLLALSRATGGVATVNTNEFGTGVDRIFAENGSYYLLGYPAPKGSAPMSLHRLTVRVNRPGVEVLARSGFETPAALVSTKGPHPPSALERAVVGPLPDGSLPLSVVAAPFANPGSEAATVAVVLGLQGRPSAVRAAETIELRTVIFTPDGRSRAGGQSQTLTFVLVPGAQNETTTYDLLSQLALPPGRYEIRIAAHRASDGLSGSVYADVEVPNFSRAPLSLSGVMLETTGEVSIPRDAFASLLPIVPTSVRRFTTADRATAFFRVYEGGTAPVAPVALAVRLIDDHDTRVVDVAGTIGLDRFNIAARSADHRFGIPLATLRAGEYLLTFDATMGATTTSRAVRFAVK